MLMAAMAPLLGNHRHATEKQIRDSVFRKNTLFYSGAVTYCRNQILSADGMDHKPDHTELDPVDLRQF